MMMSNIVTEKRLKEVQRETLSSIAEVISKTAGPYGSSTMILHDEMLTEYSKDGHKVLSNIQYFRPLERAVHDELLNITEYVVKEVGDGTTSAVQLSNIIFGKLCDYINANPGIPSHMIIESLEYVVDKISTKIREHGRDLTIDDVYNICMIATNGNVTISNDIKSIYEKIGKDVFIQVSTSNTANTVLKTFDGIFLDKGYPSPAFINTDHATCDIRNPRIYYFEDNIDTPDMINKFMAIFMNNIFEPYKSGKPEEYIPTIIMTPSVSSDIKQELAQIEQIFYSFDQSNATIHKPPFCIVTGINVNDNIDDVIMLCGCPPIKKFINPDVEEAAMAEGKAPTKETISEWYGTADEVVVDMNTTKFINPKFLFDPDAETNEDGSRPYSQVFIGLVNHLKAELKVAQEAKEDINHIGKIKRRLNHLETNFVEYFVGGVAASDRDNVRDLVEDAVLNCRSAAASGVGYGANFEGYRAALEVSADMCTDDELKLNEDIADIIRDSYYELIYALYSTAFIEDEVKNKLEESFDKDWTPINLRTKSYDDSVLCSIESDPVILKAVTRIMSVMVLSNQALVQEPTRNVYLEKDGE